MMAKWDDYLFNANCYCNPMQNNNNEKTIPIGALRGFILSATAANLCRIYLSSWLAAVSAYARPPSRHIHKH